MTTEQFTEKYNIDFWPFYTTISCKDIASKTDEVKAYIEKLDKYFICAVVDLREMLAGMEYYIKAAAVNNFLIALQISVDMKEEIETKYDEGK